MLQVDGYAGYGALAYAPFMQALFATEPVPFGLGVLIVAVGAAVLGLLEVEKWIRRRRAGTRGV